MSATDTFERAHDRAVCVAVRASDLSRREAADALRSTGMKQTQHEQRAGALARYAEIQNALALTYARAYWAAEAAAS